MLNEEHEVLAARRLTALLYLQDGDYIILITILLIITISINKTIITIMLTTHTIAKLNISHELIIN